MYRLYCLSLFLLACCVRAEVNEAVETQYYEVSPSSPARMMDALQQASPIREGNRVYHGHTWTGIHWYYSYQAGSGSCRMQRVKVDLTIRYQMPTLVNASLDVFEVWNRWYPQLELHEQRHGQIGRDIARAIEQGISRLSASDCDALERKANTFAEQQIQVLKHRHKDYDERTQHGKTEGTFLSDYL
jgi:predicted secreted Zn-dependent protease